MNLARLRRLNAKLQETAREFDAEMAAPEAAGDPLALFIYQARARLTCPTHFYYRTI